MRSGETSLFGVIRLRAQQRQCSEQHYCRRNHPPLVRSGETTLFGGLYCPSLRGWYCRYLWAQQRAALLCRRDRPPLVRSVGKLLCSSVVSTLSADWHMYNPLLCYLPLHYCWGGCCPFFIRLVREPPLSYPPPTLLFGQMLPVSFLYGWCANLYCPTAPLHYCKGRCCPFLYGWLCDFSLCYSPPKLLLGWMLPVFYTVGARSSTILPPPTLLLGQMLPVFLYGWRGEP